MSMPLSSTKVKRIGNAIRTILLEDWDPIGVYMAGPDDEYDTYIWPIFRRLRDGAGAAKVSDYLFQLEQDIMGCRPENRDRINVASKKLISLKRKMNF